MFLNAFKKNTFLQRDNKQWLIFIHKGLFKVISSYSYIIPTKIKVMGYVAKMQERYHSINFQIFVEEAKLTSQQ